VVEGRDIGSVVLPQADIKVFLTADPGVRAQRRAAEVNVDDAGSVSATEDALRARDAKDTTRAISPLAPADGCIEIDTTHLTFDVVVDAVISLVRDAPEGR
jgi:cytidylate kinase